MLHLRMANWPAGLQIDLAEYSAMALIFEPTAEAPACGSLSVPILGLTEDTSYRCELATGHVGPHVSFTTVTMNDNGIEVSMPCGIWLED